MPRAGRRFSFNWHSYGDDGALTSRSNATEAFRRVAGEWRWVIVPRSRVRQGQPAAGA